MTFMMVSSNNYNDLKNQSGIDICQDVLILKMLFVVIMIGSKSIISMPYL